MYKDAVHLSDESTAAYLDGELFGPARAAVERHLAGCPDCTLQVVETQHALQAAGLLPLCPHHALEEGLAYLQAIIRLPLWTINLLLYLATFGLIGLVPYVRAIWWGDGSLKYLLPLFAEALAACYFIAALPRLRRLVVSFWSAGVPKGALRGFVERFVAPLYGQFDIPAGRIQFRLASWQTCLLFYFIGYGLWVILVDHQRGLAGLLVLAYVMLVKSVWMLTALLYLWFLIGLVGLLGRTSTLFAGPARESLRRELRSFVNDTTIVAAVAVTCWIAGAHDRDQMSGAWGLLFSGFLLLVIAGDLYCERHFFRPARFPIAARTWIREAATTALATLLACGPGLLSVAR